MTQTELRLIRLEIAFWALVILVAVTTAGIQTFTAILAAVCRIAIWRADLAAKPRGPGFWDKVWRR